LRKGPYGVNHLNAIVEECLFSQGLLDLNRKWYKGRPIIISQNDYQLNLFNGDIGLVFPDPTKGDLKAFFTELNKLRTIILPALPGHETVFAMTVHKSQGSEFENILLLLPETQNPILTRELIYTGITRAKKKIEIWGNKEVFCKGVSKRIERFSGLHDALQNRM